MQETPTLGTHNETGAELMNRMRTREMDSLFIVDDAQKLIGYVTLEDAQESLGKPAHTITSNIVATIEEEATMRDAFSEMLSYGIRFLPVLDHQKRLVGMVSADDAQTLIKQRTSVAAIAL